MLSRGPDLHLTRCELDYNPQQESPTSLAMYSSCAFTFWRSGLCDLRIDTKAFIEQELERSSLVDWGWKADALLTVFEYDFEQAYCPIGVKYCHSCGTRNYGMRVQPFCRHLLERVRLGIGTDMSSEIGPKAGGTLDNNTNRSLKVQGTITKENIPYYNHDEVCGDGVEILPSHISSRAEAQYAVEAYSTRIASGFSCGYERDAMVCMKCWYDYQRTGIWRTSKW